jgi:Spy/CpxP family protein refolding chaperone
VPAKNSALLMVVALVAGLAIGFAASTLAYRYKVLDVPGTSLLDRLNAKLDLTPVQRDQIAEILQDTRDRMIQLRHNFERQRRRNFLAAYLRIHALLTPAQQAKFDHDFIPPRFRAEAAQLEQQSGGVSPTPGATPTPLGARPSPAAS